ncbi:putative Temperature-induced lipocalin-1 [Cocos nucifera]|uniref:Putative Temperature-induced lipocalin-1 n=1 Tax=Cocos nucifera TaxID=13894 RepID=A0A8K0N5J2_COCNU|nr:putative Temperature-induced lipocalin-1 [Cocos nucifera]
MTAGTRATYALRPDGTVRVLNETRTAGGSRRASIEGTAFRAEPADEEARLKVRFYVPPFLPVFPVVGDYCVLFVDENYQRAVVGQPSRRHLWILSRQIHMEEEIYNQLVEKVKEQGYDVEKLQKTQPIDPPPLGEEGLNDTKGLGWIKSLLGK